MSEVASTSEPATPNGTSRQRTLRYHVIGYGEGIVGGKILNDFATRRQARNWMESSRGFLKDLYPNVVVWKGRPAD
jgi:hypothetical protein